MPQTLHSLSLARPATARCRRPATPEEVRAAFEISRRRFLAASAAMVALAACGDDGTNATATTRNVTGSRGPVEVPADPQRVAALVGSADIDILTLGIEPVFSGSFARGWVDLPETTITSDLVPPSVEAVAGARPDLLIGWDWLVDDPAWAQLSEIAPAISLPEAEGTSWRDVYLVVADAVNRRERGEEELAAFDERVADLHERMSTRDTISVNQIGIFEPGTFWWWAGDYPANEHLAAVGIDVVAPPEDVKEASVERLSELTAPWIIVAAPSGPDSALADLEANPLWQQLPAVKAGQVVVVDRELWGGAGLLWAHALLDDIEHRFLT